MNFWRERTGYSTEWFYCVEAYGLTQTFSKIEHIREMRDALSHTRIEVMRHFLIEPFTGYLKGKQAIRGKVRTVQFYFYRTYVYLRYQKEIVRLFDVAYEHFTSDQEGHRRQSKIGDFDRR